MAASSKESVSLVSLILNRIFHATPVLDHDPRSPAEPTPVMSTIAVVHPVDTALDVMAVTVIEALLAVATMMMTVVDTALLPEPVDQLTTTHLHVVDSRILTAVITHLTHTSMVELLMIVLLQEMLRTIMSDLPAVTDSYFRSGRYVLNDQR